MNNRLMELTQKKESVNVRESQNYDLQVATHVLFLPIDTKANLCAWIEKEVTECHTAELCTTM